MACDFEGILRLQKNLTMYNKNIDSSLAPVLASSKIDSYISLSKIFGFGVLIMGMVHHEVLDITLGVETSTLRDTVKEDKATGKMRL